VIDVAPALIDVAPIAIDLTTTPIDLAPTLSLSSTHLAMTLFHWPINTEKKAL
jgi:hypothetical protein